MIVSIIIPARDEVNRIAQVIQTGKNYSDEVVVIDDGSTDGTLEASGQAGARVFESAGQGYIQAVKLGFKKARGDIFITIDADGEHNAEDIPLLLKPILENGADLVLGKRKTIPRWSERLINWLTHLKVKVEDCGTGFRALTKDLALKLDLKGSCTCGILVLEAQAYGARIMEIPIKVNNTEKPRGIAWNHFVQFFYVLIWLFRR